MDAASSNTGNSKRWILGGGVGQSCDSVCKIYNNDSIAVLKRQVLNTDGKIFVFCFFTVPVHYFESYYYM